jgi:hypothetical protein
MSPMLNEMLVNEVVPRLNHAVRTIPKVGHEDDEEIIQDATLMAARMMNSAEKAGQRFTGGNMAWYGQACQSKNSVLSSGTSMLTRCGE